MKTPRFLPCRTPGAFLSLGAWVIAAVAAADSPPKPNVIIVMADDMGYSDLGCYGGEIETPNLDRLAANGLRFTNFYNEGRCWPTRAALMTGRYAHDVGHAMMHGPGAPSAYQGTTPERAPMISERLREAGYRCYHSGKWHLATGRMGPKINESTWAIRRGFERSYSLVNFYNFFNPAELRIEGEIVKGIGDREPDYYYTDVITDRAIGYLTEHQEDHAEAPFFLYLAHLAPHYPLHARPDDIEKYRGRYRIGWDEMRRQRHARMKELGIYEGVLSRRDPGVKAWDSLSEEEQVRWDERMAIHAAMVDCLDQGVGRVVDWLEKNGRFDNTLIFFLSDNGASKEAGGWKKQEFHDPDAAPGSRGSFLAIERGWSNASNTPFRLHKSFNHEGGIATPLIGHWPKGIGENVRGKLTRQVGRVNDVLPTVLELAGIEVPEAVTGESLVPLFSEPGRIHPRTLFWEHLGSRAVRRGDWKLVAERGRGWELYDLKSDPAETRNLAKTHPEERKELLELWEAWAGEVGWTPRGRGNGKR